ncbi:hypothetical protein AB0B01_15580 [Streptomyces sp. NPDC044571]
MEIRTRRSQTMARPPSRPGGPAAADATLMELADHVVELRDGRIAVPV